MVIMRALIQFSLDFTLQLKSSRSVSCLFLQQISFHNNHELIPINIDGGPLNLTLLINGQRLRNGLLYS